MTQDINNPEHPHHALWRECITSLYETNVPITIEYKRHGIWTKALPNSNCMPIVNWLSELEYRKAPPVRVMITRTITYPAPLEVAPKVGDKYWAGDMYEVSSYTWENDRYDREWLNRGWCYDNELDAIEAYKVKQCS